MLFELTETSMDRERKKAIFKALKIRDIRRILFDIMPSLKNIDNKIKRSKGFLYIDGLCVWRAMCEDSTSAYNTAESFHDFNDDLKAAYEQLIFETTGERVRLRTVVAKRHIHFSIKTDEKDVDRICDY